MKDITGTARVVAKPLPFKDEVLEARVASGMSLREILGSLNNNYIINLNGETIPCEDWELTFVNDDDLVLIYKIPKGDGRDILRVFAAIAVIAFAYWAAPYFAGGFASGTLATEAFWTSALMFGGMIAIGLLLPPKFDTQEGREQKRIFSATGSRNQFLPFGVVPNLYGKHRLYPPIASIPYTEVIGEDQYLNMIFCIGLGDYTIDGTQVKIGDTLATNFSDIDINITDQPTQQDIFELQLAVVLNQDTDNPGSNAIRTTATSTEEISLDFILPAGLIQIDPDDGDEHYVRLHFSVEYRPAAGGSWTFVTASDIGIPTRGSRQVIGEPSFDAPTPANTSYGSVSLSSQNINWLMVRARTRDPFRMGFKFDPGSTNQWEVRVTRQRTQLDTRGFFTSASNTWDEYAATFTWTALRSFSTGSAITIAANTATFLTLRVRATDQLNGVIDSLNLIAERKLRKWNKVGQVFDAPAVTRDPAWAFLNILTGLGNARPITDEAANIWLDDLADWATDNTTEGRFYDEVIDYSTSIFDALTKVCGVGRAALSNRDGKWTVILEQAGGSPVQHFTPRNSWNFGSTKRFVDFPHAYKVRFTSEDADYQEAEQIVYDNGFDSLNATQFEVLELSGITDADHAWKTARYTMAAVRLRPEIYTFYADVEHIVAQRGDHVLVAHDIPLWGTVYGRITDIAGNVVTLDNDTTLDGLTSYRMRVRKNDGTSAIEDLTLQGGTNIFTHTFTPTIPAGINVGDLAMVGEIGVETAELVIVGIEPQADLAAKITCVDHNAAILTADTGVIPAWDPGITLPPDPRTISPVPPYAVHANSDSTTYTVDGSGVLLPRITVTWDLVAGAAERWNALTADLRWREYDATSLDLGTWNFTSSFNAFQAAISIENVTVGSEYEIQMRTVSPYNVTSAWSVSILHTVGGDTRSAAVPTTLTATGVIAGVYVSWTSPISSVFNTVEVWASDDNVRGNAVKIHTTTNDNYIESIPDLERRTRYYWVRAIDSLNRVSDWEPNTTTTTASAQPRDPDANWVADPEFDLSTTSPDNEFWDEFEAQGTSPVQTGSISLSTGTGVDGSNTMDIVNSLGTGSFFTLTSEKAQILKNKNALFQFSLRYKTVGAIDALDHTGFTVNINHKYVDDPVIYQGGSVPISLARSTIWTDTEFTHKILFPTATKTLEWARFGIKIESTVGTRDTFRLDSLQVLHIGSVFGDVTAGTTKLSGNVPEALTAEATKYLKGDGTWDDPPGGSASNSFETQTVTDTDSGHIWLETGSAVAELSTDTLTWVSGSGIDIDVSPTTDAIRIEATGGGGAQISGTPANNQIAVWTNATTIEGDTDLRWDGAKLQAWGSTGIAHIDISHDNSLGLIETTSGVLQLDPANGQVWVKTASVDSQIRTYGSAGAQYTRMYHTDTLGYIETSVGTLFLASANAEVVIARSGFNAQVRAYGSGGSNYIRIRNDNVNGYLETIVAGDLYLSSVGGDIFLQDTTHLQDNINLTFGTGNDATIDWNSTSSTLSFDVPATTGYIFTVNGTNKLALNTSSVQIYHSGTLNISTQTYNASGSLTGGLVRHVSNVLHDIGLGVMPEVTFTSSRASVATDWHRTITHTGTANTTLSLTLNTASTVPDDAVMWVKARNGPVTLVDGTMVLSKYKGDAGTSAPPTGNITIARGGWATIHKTGNSTADVTGVGI